MNVRPRVFVTRRLPGRALERLAQRGEPSVWEGAGAPPPEALAAGARDAEGLLCLLTDPINVALLAACPRLRAISSCSVGVDHIDLEAAKARVGSGRTHAGRPGGDDRRPRLRAAARRRAAHPRSRSLRARGALELRARLGIRRCCSAATCTGRRWESSASAPSAGAVARRASGFGMRILGWSPSGRSRGRRRGAVRSSPCWPPPTSSRSISRSPRNPRPARMPPPSGRCARGRSW